MSTSALARNAPGLIAAHLQKSNKVHLSPQEQLFDEALKAVRDRKSAKDDLPSIFERLRHAKDIEDIRYVLVLERQNNKLWRERKDKSWTERLANLAQNILSFRSVIDAAAGKDNIAGPIWSALAFVLAVFEDFNSTIKLLNDAEFHITQSLKRLSKYFSPRDALTQDVEAGIKKYYTAVIDLFIVAMHEFSKGRIAAYLTILQRNLKSSIDNFTIRTERILTGLDRSAQYDKMVSIDIKADKISDCVTTLVTVGSTPSHYGVSYAPKTFTYGIPVALISKTFAGRANRLADIQTSLNDNPFHRLSATGLYGMAGVGKTQSILQYISWVLAIDNRQTTYSTVLYFDASSRDRVMEQVAGLVLKLKQTDNTFKWSNCSDIEIFHAWLELRVTTLVVLDNIDVVQDVEDILPRGITGHVLISTRHRYIAESILPQITAVEIRPLATIDACGLLFSSCGEEELASTTTRTACHELAEVAEGLPLLIDIFIKMKLRGRDSFESILQEVKSRSASSDVDSTSRARDTMEQVIKTLKKNNHQAAALFDIVVYLNTTSIPVTTLKSIVGELESYLMPRHTYTKGCGLNPPEVIKHDSVSKDFSLTDIEPFQLHTWPDGVRKLMKARKQRKQKRELLADDIELRQMVQAVAEDTAMGVLLSHNDNIDAAIAALINTGMVSVVEPGYLWMHDFVAEVGRTIIEKKLVCLHLAAMMTYFSLYTPSQYAPQHERQQNEQVLPHAITVHRHLVSINLLTRVSVGAELSHLIASIILEQIGGPHQYTSGPSSDYDQAYHKYRRSRFEEVLVYYRHALICYKAGWDRLLKFGIPAFDIAESSSIERQFAQEHCAYTRSQTFSSYNRYGFSAPWRTAQTASKLAIVLEQIPGHLDAAVTTSRIALSAHGSLFAAEDEDSMSCRYHLCEVLSKAKQWQEVHDAALRGACILAKASNISSKDTRSILEQLSTFQAGRGMKFAHHLGVACLHIAQAFKQPSTPGDRQLVVIKAHESIAWLNLVVSHITAIQGEAFYSAVTPLTLIAQAHEVASESSKALAKYAEAVYTRLHEIIWQNSDPLPVGEYDPSKGAALGDEDAMAETVEMYISARERLGQREDVMTDKGLQRYMGFVDGKVAFWLEEKRHGEEVAAAEKAREEVARITESVAQVDKVEEIIEEDYEALRYWVRKQKNRKAVKRKECAVNLQR